MNCSSLKQIKEVPRTPVIVNGVEIPYDEIAREVQFHRASSPIQAWKTATRALVVRSLLLQEARRRKIVPQPIVENRKLRETEDEAMVRQLIKQQVNTPSPDKESCYRYYVKNKSKFRTQAIFEASHILLSASKSDKSVYADRCLEAKRLIEILRESPEEFKSLARNWSDCSSASQGGNLGQIVPGQTTPEFESELLIMSPGEISAKPVESPYGFHIIRLHQRLEGKELPFNIVCDRIAQYLHDRVERMAIAQYIARLVSVANLEGVELPDAQELRVY